MSRIVFEKLIVSFSSYRILEIIDIIPKIFRKIGFPFPGLDKDAIHINHNFYPYPSKNPNFISFIGTQSIYNWDNIAKNRIIIYNLYCRKLSNYKYLNLPKISESKTTFFVPLRFIFTTKYHKEIRKILKNFINVRSIWFRKPVISGSKKLSLYNYIAESCPIAEDIGKKIINLPLDLNIDQANEIINSITRKIK